MNKNAEYLKHSIMNQARHQFIYGYDGKESKIFLKEMAENYPIKLNSNKPIGIYLENIGFPNLPTIDGLDKYILALLAKSYCDLLIMREIIDTTIKQVDENDLKENIKTFLVRCIFSQSIDFKNITLTNLKELRTILNETIDVYYNGYVNYIKEEKLIFKPYDLPIKTTDLLRFIREYKIMINNNSNISLIIDYKNPVALISLKAINELINKRSNADISMKVACNPAKWLTYHDTNGSLIEAIHDYGTAEFDDSYKEYTKELRYRFYKK